MPTIITIRNNGSIRIDGTGDIELRDEAGNVYDLAGRTGISLCRCGHSSKKPFCDSTHKTVGFTSVCDAYALEPPKPKV